MKMCVYGVCLGMNSWACPKNDNAYESFRATQARDFPLLWQIFEGGRTLLLRSLGTFLTRPFLGCFLGGRGEKEERVLRSSNRFLPRTLSPLTGSVRDCDVDPKLILQL